MAINDDCEGKYVSVSHGVKDHLENPKNLGTLSHPDIYTSYTGTCGNTMKIWLNVKDERVEEIAFQAEGDDYTVACGSIATELLKGKKVIEVGGVNPQKIIDELGGLPEDRRYSALLVSNALREAVKDYLLYNRECFDKN